MSGTEYSALATKTGSAERAGTLERLVGRLEPLPEVAEMVPARRRPRPGRPTFTWTSHGDVHVAAAGSGGGPVDPEPLSHPAPASC
jgi:hypothetical protein